MAVELFIILLHLRIEQIYYRFLVNHILINNVINLSRPYTEIKSENT